MTDLERFFRRLAARLATSEPDRLHQPLALDDIQSSIIPYRSNRRALEVESSEDYEAVLLRLCAGEDGLARTEPEAARKRFVEELESPNPDLAVLHRFEHVQVTLSPDAVARALRPAPDPDLAFAPPPRLGEPGRAASVEDVQDDALFEPESEVAGPQCLYCGGTLPSDRPVRFCPHCGQRQAPPECPRCHSEVDPGWRHCVSCGAALADR